MNRLILARIPPRTVRLAAGGTALCAALVLVQAASSGNADSAPLVISRLRLVSSRAVSPHVVEEKYSAKVTHTGRPGSADLAGVRGRLVRLKPLWPTWPLEVVDGDLQFGNVRSGRTVESIDTVSIRRHHSAALKPDQFKWAVSGAPDLVLPERWAGRWRFTLTLRDTATNQVVAVDEMTSDVGTGEALGASLLPDFVKCRWSGSDAFVDASCSLRALVIGCRLKGSSRLTLERDDDAIAGRADWEASGVGSCGLGGAIDGGWVEIAGARIAELPDPPSHGPALIERVAIHPGLLTLLAFDGGK